MVVPPEMIAALAGSGGSEGGGGGGGAGQGGPFGQLLGSGALDFLGVPLTSSILSRADRIEDIRIPKTAHFQSFGFPRIFQFLAAGGSLSDLEVARGARRRVKRDAKRQGLNPNTDFLILGKGRKNRIAARIPTTQELEEQFGRQETRLIERQKQTLKKLEGTPFFDAIVGDIGGASSGLANAQEALARQALGGAAGRGINLRDPASQSRVLGPLALQGFLAQRDLQRQSGLAALNLARGGGTPFAQSQPSGIPFFTNNFFATKNLQQQASMFNAQSKAQGLGFGAGVRGGFLQSLFGAQGLGGFGPEEG